MPRERGLIGWDLLNEGGYKTCPYRVLTPTLTLPPQGGGEWGLCGVSDGPAVQAHPEAFEII